MAMLLGVDIGKRRTGLALADTQSGFVFALDTFKHNTDEELLAQLLKISSEKKIGEFIVGLPRLPQGEEGAQVAVVRAIGEELKKRSGLPISYLDERYTSLNSEGSDPDAKAACDLLSVALEQRSKMS